MRSSDGLKMLQVKPYDVMGIALGLWSGVACYAEGLTPLMCTLVYTLVAVSTRYLFKKEYYAGLAESD